MLENGLLYFSLILMAVLELDGLRCDDVTSHPNYKLVNLKLDCGRHNLLEPSPSAVSGRIRGGEDALLAEFPWMVYLEISREYWPAEQANFCGGSLINYRYVLSAAHCVQHDGAGIQKLRIVARIGDWNLPDKDSHRTLLPTDRQDCQDGRCASQILEIKVSEYHGHSGFGPHGHNDICLMRLSKTVQFNDFVRPICLPLSCYLQEKDLECYELTVTGWGFQNENNRFPNILQKLEVEVVGNGLCQEKYLGDKVLVESQLCAGTVSGQSTCRGDSGGPLMLDQTIRNTTTLYLMGIDSFGYPCHRPGDAPHVFTKVSSYVRWILNKIRP